MPNIRPTKYTQPGERAHMALSFGLASFGFVLDSVFWILDSGSTLPVAKMFIWFLVLFILWHLLPYFIFLLLGSHGHGYSCDCDACSSMAAHRYNNILLM